MKYILYDIKQGFVQARIKFLFLIIVIVFSCISFYSETQRVVGDIKPTYADYVLGCFEGVSPYENIITYEFCISWLLVQIIIAFMIGDYVRKDLNGFGTQVLIRTQNRVKWWLSKCVYNVLVVLCSYIVMHFIICIYCVVTGTELSLDFTQKIMSTIVTNTEYNMAESKNMLLVLYIMPCLTSIVVSLLQILLTMYTSSVVSIICIMLYMFASTVITNRLLIGNYSMLAKYDIGSRCSNGIYIKDGISIFSLLCIVLIVIGCYSFKNKDIMD